MNRIRKIAAMAIMAMTVFTSCRQDMPFTSGEEGNEPVLSAYKERRLSRADVTGDYFDVGTKYRIWVIEKETSDSKIDITELGIEGTESLREEVNMQYIDLSEKLTGRLDFYGFTDGTKNAPEPSVVESEYPINLLPEYNGGDYTDYRRGELLYDKHQTTSGILRMPFKHIMAQVKLEVMKEENVNSRLELVSVEFIGEETGVTTGGTYNVKENTFTNPVTGTRMVLPQKELLPVPNISSDADAAWIRTVLVFPEASDAPLYYLRVTFNDPENFYKKGTSGVKIDIPIYDNQVSGNQPLHFAQNTSYTLCISFLSNQARIVTLVPKVYEWLDGETDETDENGNGYQEQDMGQPVTFNGVMWSDRNLGATSGHAARSIQDWYKSVGYFYQYGRNIPYFPNSLNEEDGTIDLKTPLEEALVTNGVAEGDRPLYPVVNFESWGLDASQHTKNIAPADVKDYSWVWKLGSYKQTSQNYWGFSYDTTYKTENLEDYEGGWENNTDTPCPPGWRLPTVADYKGIVPGSAYSGNITFRWFKEVDGNGSWISDWNTESLKHRGTRNREPEFERIFVADSLKIYNGISGVSQGQQIYKGAFPCLFREEQNDPENGTKSKYILSMMDEDGYRDWNRVCETAGELKKGAESSYIYNWGVIYGIKRQGTTSAYRVKWEVKLLSKETPTPKFIPNTTKQYLHYIDNPFRGVLVISRYQASAKDDFLPDENGEYKAAVKQYDWEHPVEVMYLPVGGFADNWSKGKLGNIGTELWYAISDRTGITDVTRKHIMWFKFAGTNTASQTMIISNRSRMCAAVQIRCVRDLTNK